MKTFRKLVWTLFSCFKCKLIWWLSVYKNSSWPNFTLLFVPNFNIDLDKYMSEIWTFLWSIFRYISYVKFKQNCPDFRHHTKVKFEQFGKPNSFLTVWNPYQFWFQTFAFLLTYPRCHFNWERSLGKRCILPIFSLKTWYTWGWPTSNFANCKIGQWGHWCRIGLKSNVLPL